MQWDAPSNNGGSELTSYRIMWNGGEQIPTGKLPTIILVDTLVSSRFHTQTGLTRGYTYVFTVSAVNAVGVGIATEGLTLVAS